jgi:hypothetical protein
MHVVDGRRRTSQHEKEFDENSSRWHTSADLRGCHSCHQAIPQTTFYHRISAHLNDPLDVRRYPTRKTIPAAMSVANKNEGVQLYHYLLPCLEDIQRGPYLFSISGPTFRRCYTVLDRVLAREVACFLVFRKGDQVEQSAENSAKKKLINQMALKIESSSGSPLDRTDCIGESIESRPISITFRLLYVAIEGVANITCSIYEHVGHVRIPLKGDNIAAQDVDEVLDNLCSRISLVWKLCEIHEQGRGHDDRAS